jgi:DNA-binding transcriptional ArsR family regulator
MSMDAVFRALADESRRHLLDHLHAKNGQTLGELCVDLNMSRQAVTKHLAILQEANLVAARRRGPGETAIPQSGSDQRDRRTLDRQIQARAPARTVGSQENIGRTL